jgi:hypothetical protein
MQTLRYLEEFLKDPAIELAVIATPRISMRPTASPPFRPEKRWSAKNHATTLAKPTP